MARVLGRPEAELFETERGTAGESGGNITEASASYNAAPPGVAPVPPIGAGAAVSEDVA